MLSAGQGWPLLRIAARIRSRVSRTLVCGRPAMLKRRRPVADDRFGLDEVAINTDNGGPVGAAGSGCGQELGAGHDGVLLNGRTRRSVRPAGQMTW